MIIWLIIIATLLIGYKKDKWQGLFINLAYIYFVVVLLSALNII